MSETEPSSRVIATLDRLDAADWFGRVGENDFDLAIQASSWKQAAKFAKSDAWEAICLEAANLFREKLLSTDKSRFKKWNDNVRLIRPFCDALINDKTSKNV